MFAPRAWMLYLAMAVALFFLLDRDQVGDDILNACRPSMDYVHDFSYGKNNFSKDELKRSIAYYETLLLANANQPFAYANMGFCYFYLGDTDRAVDCYRKSLALASYVYATYFDLGFVFLSRGDYAQSARYFEKSRSLIPLDRQKFLEVLKIPPKYQADPGLAADSVLFQRIAYDLRMIHVHLGKIYLQLKDYARLKYIADEGVLLFPEDPQMYYYTGVANLNLNNVQQALIPFNQALVLAPDLTDAYFYRSQIWQVLGQASLYQADMAKYQELTKTGGWKRQHNVLDLHHWHDMILFFQMNK